MHLVGEELGGGESNTRGDDALDGGVVGEIHVEADLRKPSK